MKSVSFTIPNGYAKLPEEDSLAFVILDNTIFGIIADGITRDPRLPRLPKHNTKEFESFVKTYPIPSPSKIVSDILCSKFIEKMIENAQKDNSIISSLEVANTEIKMWNKKNIKNINYLDKDFGGTIAAAFKYYNGNLDFVYNADCGIAIFDKLGKRKFISEDLMLTADKNRIDAKIDIEDWNDNIQRANFRKEFRNKVKLDKNGKCLSFGAFTGEKRVFLPELIKKGSLKISTGDFIIAFTDGARDYIENTNKIATCLSTDIASLKTYLSSNDYTKKERSIIAIQIT